jgi:tetratricopeptide (TPR) repeat protein
MTSVRIPTLFALLVCAAMSIQPSGAQAPPPADASAAGRLSLSTKSAAAKEEFWRGMQDWQTGAYTGGARHFRRASDLDKDFALARLMSMGEYEARGHPAERDKAVADAARQSTEEGLVALFWREKALGNADRMRAILRAAMQVMPNEPSVAVEYVWLSNGQGKDPKVPLDSARALVGRFPNYTPLAFPISFLELTAGDTAGALRAAEEYTRIAPRTPAAFGNYGFLLQQTGRYDEAEAQYRKGMALLPTRPDYGWDPASSLAEMYALRGRYTDARAVATEALGRVTTASDSALYLAELAGTYLGTGDNRRAVQLLEQAREKSPTVGSGQNPQEVDYLLAEANAIAGDVNAMRSYMSRRHPQTAVDSAIHVGNYALNYTFAGQPDSAMVYSDRLAKITAVPWSGPWSHRIRGLALVSARQCTRAQSELVQAIDTASPQVRLARAECELQSGKRTEALALRDRATSSLDFVLFDPAYVRERVRLAQIK